MPAADTPGTCADVGALRACWDAAGRATLVPRPVPAVPASSPMGWRCAGAGPTRLCVDRATDAPAFTCAGERCAQRHARRPDDGEWTCVDTAGAVLCVGGDRAAGIVAGPPDPAWICGARRPTRARDLLGGRVCVDLAPDFPDGDGTRWRCHAQPGPAGGRACQRVDAPPVLGASCAPARPCVDGASCVGGRCLPGRPAPSCWLDDECPGGACRFGSCRHEGTP